MRRAVMLVGVSGLYAYASACCGVSPKGQTVAFGDQSNIIVWNPETKTEHFVRNAFFSSQAKDFGFIAATPDVPKLAEADPVAFDRLEEFKPRNQAIPTEANYAPPTGAARVDVLQQVEVGKYQATTVRSDSSHAMAEYLEKNGYVTNPDTDEWIRFYTAKKWVFTAFKVIPSKDTQAATGVIRMSFKTDEPFNPYYIPASNSGGSGTLKLYFVSDGTYSATIGHKQEWVPQSWNAKMDGGDVSPIAGLLNLTEGDFPQNPTVTYFEQHSWMNGDKDDIYFKKDSPSRSIVLVALFGAGAGLWWFTRRNRLRATFGGQPSRTEPSTS